MTEIRQTPLTGERALFQGSQLRIIDSIFSDGESPLKESRDIQMIGSMFKWKHPSDTPKTSRPPTVPGSRWQEPASGTPITSGWRTPPLKRPKTSAAARI